MYVSCRAKRQCRTARTPPTVSNAAEMSDSDTTKEEFRRQVRGDAKYADMPWRCKWPSRFGLLHLNSLQTELAARHRAIS